MIDVKEATKLATEYFTDLFEEKYSDLTLEEVEISEDGKFWYFKEIICQSSLVPVSSSVPNRIRYSSSFAIFP
ncbi:MAG: hypothetical protein SCARUB_05011 [Candidatus Scalindua rubra]|uniref:Uncharacterized protein n=1 Tax=Candidatus Scalindua rubra TaxID=1872076 RepID=A0A1E3X2S5_9BACT|nr:MAG: hypothetical protein SCARUB_05011 [Candidatus Scalindua rubra]